VIEHVSLEAQQVYSGAGRCEAASSTLLAEWQAARDAIQALSNPSAFGTGGPAESFKASLMQGGGPDVVLFGGGGEEVVKQVTELGRRLTEVVDRSLAGDEEACAEILNSVQGV